MSDVSKFQKQMFTVIQAIESDGFRDYIGKRLEESLKFIQKELLTTIKTDEDIQLSTYMNSNHLEIVGDAIYIYNDAKIDIASKNMQETTKANYPAQLSLAKIVEYGIGWSGEVHTTNPEVVENWEYDVNRHGPSGWYYKDSNGEVHWTNGFAGRLIFFHLKEFVAKSMNTWIKEYMKEKM